MQRGVDAMMVFAQNLQCQPAFKLPQRHGCASLRRIVAPVLDTRKCGSPKNVHRTHGGADETLYVTAEVRPGDRPVDHLNTKILEGPGDCGRVEFTGIIEVHRAR